MKKLFLISICTLIAYNSAQSQHVQKKENEISLCGYDHYQEQYLTDDVSKKMQEQYEKAYRNYITSSAFRDKSMAVQTLPVVVHILHSGEPLGTEDNPTDAQITTEISQASERFRQLQPNAGSYSNPLYGVDPEIELCLSNVDPNGNYTSGVLRYYEPNNTINPTSAFVSTILWDVTKYLNIVIAKDINACGRYRGGVDYTEYQANCFWDGLICHELGHQFSLGHTFNGGCSNGDCLSNGDNVCDTPPKATSGSGGNACGSASADSCLTDDDDLTTNNPYRPVANGGVGNQPDMLENYMDYTASCWDAFTSGQKDRMQFNITNNRTGLSTHSSIACAGPSSLPNDIGIYGVNSNQSDNCQQIIFPDFNVFNYGTNTVNSCQIKIYSDGILSSTEVFNNINILPSQSTNLTSTNGVILQPGIGLLLKVEALLPNNTVDLNIHNNSDYSSTTFIQNSSCYNACQNFSNNSSSGGSTIVNVNGNFISATTMVDVCYTVEGDLSLPTETFNVFDENQNLIGTTTAHGDCSGPTSVVCIQVSASDYNNWISDNQITVTFTPTSNDINPFLCSTNQACVDIYVPDNNSNCPSSLNLTGTNSGNNSNPNNQNDNESSGVITSSQTIAASATIDYDSATEINLLEGFQTLIGALFEAFIDGCNNGAGGNNTVANTAETDNK